MTTYRLSAKDPGKLWSGSGNEKVYDAMRKSVSADPTKARTRNSLINTVAKAQPKLHQDVVGRCITSLEAQGFIIRVSD